MVGNNYSAPQVGGPVNPLMNNSDLQILLCLMPDDFTRQRETPWALKG